MIFTSNLQLYRDFQRVGVSKSFFQKDVILNTTGGHFNDQIIDLAKSGAQYKIVGYNFDLRVQRHDMTKEASNIDLHYFATSIVFDRISLDHLPNDHPARSLQECPVTAFMPNEKETNAQKNCYKVLVTREIGEACPALAFLKSVAPQHIQHKYSGLYTK